MQKTKADSYFINAAEMNPYSNPVKEVKAKETDTY